MVSGQRRPQMWKQNDSGEYMHESGKVFVWKHGVRSWAVYAMPKVPKSIKIPGGYFTTRKAAVEAFEKENNA
jgi:hypothetical protein